MDFGDILNQWGDMQRNEKRAAKERAKVPQVSHKMANAPTPEEKAARKRARLAAEGRTYEAQWKKMQKKQSIPWNSG